MISMPTEGGWPVRGGWVVRQLAADLGITLVQAAGIAGNIGYESAGFTKLQEQRPTAGRGGYGWAQWTGPRRRNYEAWCETHKLDSASDEANYGFLLHEMRGDFDYLVRRLRKLGSMSDSTSLVHQEYERPSDVLDQTFRSFGARLDWAQRAFNGAKPLIPPLITESFDDVKECLKLLQFLLALRGLYPDDLIDGVPGPRTTSALENWHKGTSHAE